jgi:mRNA-degrading endonuclease RelE of RelBE toxin-antitoxin system
MRLKRGEYKFLVAVSCGTAYDNAVKKLQKSGIDEIAFQEGLHGLLGDVEQGNVPAGAESLQNQDGYYAITIQGFRIHFHVDQDQMVLKITGIGS